MPGGCVHRNVAKENEGIARHPAVAGQDNATHSAQENCGIEKIKKIPHAALANGSHIDKLVAENRS
jgi:hypothetical protein